MTMTITTMIANLFDALVRRAAVLKWLMVGVLALLVLMDVLIPSDYDRFFWEQLPGFGAFYGFVGCVLIIVLSKLLGKWLFRPEDYYRNGVDHD